MAITSACNGLTACSSREVFRNSLSVVHVITINTFLLYLYCHGDQGELLKQELVQLEQVSV